MSQQPERKALHLPRVPDDGFGPDVGLLRRAGRLNAAAKAVGAIDLKAVAATYQQEIGGSGIEAAAAATAAMNAALRSALLGEAGAEAAERQVRNLGRRQARQAHAESHRIERAEEDGLAGDARREQTLAELDDRALNAIQSKAERVQDEAANRRAVREERASAANMRRNIAEARARFGGGAAQAAPDRNGFASPAPPTDDPVLLRARKLCDGATKVVAQLEAQDTAMKANFAALTKARSAAPAPSLMPPRSSAMSEEDALVARAKALLVDYKPAEQQRKAPVRAPARPRHFGSSVGRGRSSPAGLH